MKLGHLIEYNVRNRGGGGGGGGGGGVRTETVIYAYSEKNN